MIGLRVMIHKIKLPGLLLFFCLLPLLSEAQSIKIKTLFDSTSITIGDQIRFRIEIDQPKNARVQMPVLTDTLAGKIEIVKAFPADTSKKDDQLHIRQDYLISCFDSGFYQVNPIVFPFEMAQHKDTISSAPAFLKVNSMPLDTAKDVRDIKPPLNAPFSLAEIWLYLLIALGLILIGFAVWYLIKKSRKEPILTSKKVIEPPHVVAIRELDKLRAEKLWQNNKAKEYYTRLTEIVRVYIEHQFGIYALEMTSDEIIHALKGVNFEDEKSIDLLRSMFLSADLVKFAKSEPLPDENEINLLNTYQFVNNTLTFHIQPPEEDIEIQVNSGSPVNSSHHPAKSNFIKKYNLLPFLLFPKKLRFFYRIGILALILGVLSYEAVPDLIFNIQRGNAPTISLSQLKKLAYGDIPRYFSISEAVVPSTSYVKVSKKKNNGQESFRYIYYPVFPASSGDSSTANHAYVVVKDFHATENELKSNQYFTSGSFKIEGKFSGDRITSEIKKLFTDGGIEIESDAIILERDSEPWSSVLCILFILLGMLTCAWICISFIPEIVFIRKFIHTKVTQ
jgi:hypothetical protein